MLLVENYYTQHKYLETFDPYNIIIQEGPNFSSYSVYDIDRCDLFSLAIQYGFQIEKFLCSDRFRDVVKLSISRQVSNEIYQPSTIIKLYTTA